MKRNSLVPTNFGDMLKYLRRRVQITQRELAIAVGYTEAHVCRLEKNERMPDLTTVAALFVPALYLEDEPDLLESFLKLAASARSEKQIASIKINRITIEHQAEQFLGDLEDVPPLYDYFVPRSELLQRLQAALKHERWLTLTGMAGSGKTSLAAALAREYSAGPVFWITLAAGVNTSAETILRQLALFFLAHGQEQVRLLINRPADLPAIPPDQQIALIRAAIKHQPALLCFDDAHHLISSDPASVQLGLELLKLLAATTSAAILITSRQELPLSAVQINLTGLAQSEAQRLLQNLGATLPAAETNRLTARTDGNPMLIRLAAGQLVEAGANSRAFIDHLETQPQLAAYLLNNVLSDLSPTAAWLASLLAVFRQPVNLLQSQLIEILQAASPSDNLALAHAELQKRHLITDLQRASLHPLIKNHLLARLQTDPHQLKRLHRLAAEWYRCADELLEAAYHYLIAGQVRQVLDLVEGQEEILIERGLSLPMADLLSEALRLVETQRSPGRTDLERWLHTARGNMLIRSTRTAEAEQDFRSAMDRTDNPQVRADLVYRMLDPLVSRNAYAEFLSLAQSAASGLAQTDALLKARMSAACAVALYNLTRFEESRQAAEECLEIAGHFINIPWRSVEEVVSRAHYVIANCARIRRDRPAALYHARQSLEAARRGGLRRAENNMTGFIGGLLYDQGEIDASARFRNESLEGALALGDYYWAAYCMIHLSANDYVKIDAQSALAHLDGARDLLQTIGDAHGLADQSSMRATILIMIGQIEAARIETQQLILNYENRPRMFGYYLKKMAMVHIVSDPIQVHEAQAVLQKALELPATQKDPMLRFDLNTVQAIVALDSGDPASARQILEDSPWLEGVSRSIQIERRLVDGWISLSEGRSDLALAISESILQESANYPLFVRIAQRLAAAAQTPGPHRSAKNLWVLLP